MFAVVILQNSKEVMVAASNWLSVDKKQCYWPPFKSTEKCMEAVRKGDEPAIGWEKLHISFHGEYATFEQAKDGEKEVKEWSIQLASGSPGIKRPNLENTDVPTTSTSRLTTENKDELLQMLRDIKSTVQENSAMLKKLLKDNSVYEVPSSSGVPSKDVQTSLNLNLPLKTIEDVARIEKELKSPKTRKNYVKHLSELGGFGPKDVIRNIMQTLLKDELAKEFNWKGRGDKKAFSQLILTDVIRDAALKQKINKADCETEIKKYLIYKADRLRRKELQRLSDAHLLEMGLHTSPGERDNSESDSETSFSEWLKAH